MGKYKSILDTIKRKYYYEDGKLKRLKDSPCRYYKAGYAIGSEHNNGYVYATVYTPDGGRYQMMAHRLVWMYHNGLIPKDKDVDHINGNKSDNRIENLRLLSHRKNCLNRDVNKLKGVTFFKNRWLAQIVIDGKQKYLGRFKSKEEARKVFEDAWMKRQSILGL